MSEYLEKTMRCELYDAMYVARIEGKDPNYILKRTFLPIDYSDETYVIELETGVYDCAYSVYACETCDCVYSDREWLIVFNGWSYSYRHMEMNTQYILYTLFCIKVQQGLSPMQAIAEIYGQH